MRSEREVAGLRCSQVLQRLPEFLEGTLGPEARQQVLRHLEGCDWCAQFGGEYAQVVADLQATLAEPEPLDPALAARIKARLDVSG
jgi:anti-sigma factor RsiW